MDTMIMCAVTAAALDICLLVLMISARREKHTEKKRWNSKIRGMELADQDTVYELGCDEILIGRHASADIRLPDLSVSRYHAMLNVNASGDWSITDIGSKSGLFVNGELVTKAVLHENDIIGLGNRRLIFRRHVGNA